MDHKFVQVAIRKSIDQKYISGNDFILTTFVGNNGIFMDNARPHLKILWHGEDISAGDSERSKKEMKTEEEMGR